jgi:hypothetical protein
VWQRIHVIIGDENVEKYRAHWRFASEQLVFLASFTHWLERHELININDTIAIIGGTNRFKIGLRNEFSIHEFTCALLWCSLDSHSW